MRHPLEALTLLIPIFLVRTAENFVHFVIPAIFDLNNINCIINAIEQQNKFFQSLVADVCDFMTVETVQLMSFS
jgi:hypothetical protein